MSTNFVQKATGASPTGLTDSVIFDNGTNVGIGTTAPGAILNTQGSIATAYDATATSASGGQGDKNTALVENMDTTDNSFAQLMFRVSGNSGPSLARIVALKPAAATSDFAFVLRNGSAQYEAVRFRGSTGNVGIGTTAPTSLLHVVGAQPASMGTTPGAAATTIETLVGGTGGDTTIATTGVGGAGAALSITGGAGGKATAAATASTGGKGGSLTVTAGVGGAATVAGTGTNTGGAGGDITVNPGAGGAASGGSVNTAGASGNLLLATGGGNVGVGTTSPSLGVLDIRKNSNVTSPLNGVGFLFISNTNGGSGVATGIEMSTQAGFYSGIYTINVGTSRANQMAFATMPGAGTIPVEAVRIDQNGNVGIGTTAPAGLLDVRGSSASVNPQIWLSDTNIGGRTWRLGPGISAASKFELFDNTASVSRILVDATGNVGIGTSSPGYLLDAAGSGAGSLDIARLQNTIAAANNSGSEVLFAANRTTGGLTNVAAIAGLITDITNTAYKGALVFSTANNAAPAERARIDQTGNLGIGITSPLDNLHVRTSANQRGVYVDGSASSGAGDHVQLTLKNNAAGGVEWNLDSSGGGAGIGQGKLSFQMAKNENTAPLVLLTSGNVGVGTSSPGFLLDVSGSGAGTLDVARLQNAIAAANNSGSELLFASNRATSGLTNVAAIAGLITDVTNTAYKGALVFSTANNAAPAERMRIDNTGKVGIGTTAPAQVLDVNGAAAIGSLVPHSGDLVLNSNSASSNVVLQINGTTGATLNSKGFGVGAAVATDAVGGGFVKIANGFMGINTDYWMRNGGAGTAGGDFGNTGVCSPLTVSKSGGVPADQNSRVAQFWHESNTGTGTTCSVYADNSGGPVGTDTRIGFQANVGNGAKNYVFYGGNPAGTAAFVVDNVGGAVFGLAPTQIQGAGTINVSTGIFKNGTAYNNPDYVFEHHRTGRIERFAENEGASEYCGLQPLADVEQFVRTNDSLPLMAQHRDGDLFRRGDLLMSSVEEAYLYLFQLHHRITAIETVLAVAQL